MRFSSIFSIWAAIFLLANDLGYTKTITIPGDANSIQEAVEMAVSGDEILVATDWVRWVDKKHIRMTTSGVEYGEPVDMVIRNKNVTITGGYNNKKTELYTFPFFYVHSSTSTVLWVEDSQVTLHNFTMKASLSDFGSGPKSAPIHVESGVLSISDCEFISNIECKGNLNIRNSTIIGHSFDRGYAYIGGTDARPSIQMEPARQARLSIQNSTVTSAQGDSYINLMIRNAKNCEIELENSHFVGGTAYAVYGSYPNPEGSNGASIVDCTDIYLTLNDCTFQGGNGRNAEVLRFGVVHNGGSGGSGLAIQNSTVTFRGGSQASSLLGGNGGHALTTHDWNTPTGYPLHQLSAGRGGYGLSIVNSRIFLIDSPLDTFFRAQGGTGGGEHIFDNVATPPGPDGLPIYIDDNSIIEAVASVQSWELY